MSAPVGIQRLKFCCIAMQGEKINSASAPGASRTTDDIGASLYFLTTTPYSTTFCRKTWHNRAAEAAHAVTFDFSSGFYNRFPITGCRIRRFLCGIHHRRFLSRRDGFSARLLLYFLCFTSRLYNALPQEMSIAEPPQDRKNSRKGAKKLQYRE